MILIPERAGAPDNIEITPEMIEAGIAAIDPFDLQDAHEGYLSRETLVAQIYRAMEEKRISRSRS